MPPRSRPTAFEVSFGEEAGGASGSTSLRQTSLKRTNAGLGLEESRETKRRQLPPTGYYEGEHSNVEEESAGLLLTGEDPFNNSEEDEGGNMSQKPIRVLTSFTIFDTKHANEMVPLDIIDEEDGRDRQFEGVGIVFPYFANEEDEGQEDEDDDAQEDNGKLVRLGSISQFKFDYTQDNDPVWIETEYAWYILKAPSRQYTPLYQYFYSARRIAQMVISAVLRRPHLKYDDFCQRFTTTVDAFGRTYLTEHLVDAMPEIQQVLFEDGALKSRIGDKPLIRYLLHRAPPPPSLRTRRVPQRSRNPLPPIKSLLNSDLDIAVLKPEYQTPTHVTPRIAALAQGLVYEELVVVGPPPPKMDKTLKDANEKAAHVRLKALVRKAKALTHRPIVDVQREDYIGRGSRYLKSVRINQQLYQKGDFIIVPIGTMQGQEKKALVLPENVESIEPSRTLADYFWFARIVYGDADRRQFHIQWLEHSSRTMLQELGNPQELFFCNLCDHIDFKFIVAKVDVHEIRDSVPFKPDALKSEDLFVKFTYDPVLATYTSINAEQHDAAFKRPPPDNCPICPLFVEQDERKHDHALKKKGVVYGVAYAGNKYHYDDFVLYRAEFGPARIGYITDFQFPERERSTVQSTITVRLVGRVSDIGEDVRPEGVIKDERHVFLTDEKATVLVQDLICVCFVSPHECNKLEEWLAISSNHFYIKYTAPSLNVKRWRSMKPLKRRDLNVCFLCTHEAAKEREQMKEFLAYAKHNPLPTLDLFGGVAAFSTGLTEGSRCLRVTDLIEKSPSAAWTARHNHPDITVHNQCANVMLRYTIKMNEGHGPEVPKQIYDEAKSVAGPIPKVKCIIAGFPCQSHSRLNMYKKADDIKSNLILNTLSWVDYMRPDICYFENVPGFLEFSFDQVQSGLYKLEGGTEMGGLKFLVRALGDMNYQVRFALLQAAHYGTPQRRTRFFLIAAINGHVLPEFPQPTHDHPETQSLMIKIPINGSAIRPIRSESGTAPHPVVTIKDAISDLPRFDWKHPYPNREKPVVREEIRERERRVRTFACKDSSAFVHCGYTFPGGGVEYHHEPKTTYQVKARLEPTTDLQQYTRCFEKTKVDRVVSVPLRADADYRDLPLHKQQWQTSSALSAVARQKYRRGMYGRLNENNCFPTTVTNMEPTAKQSRVLNPWACGLSLLV